MAGGEELVVPVLAAVGRRQRCPVDLARLEAGVAARKRCRKSPTSEVRRAWSCSRRALGRSEAEEADTAAMASKVQRGRAQSPYLSSSSPSPSSPCRQQTELPFSKQTSVRSTPVRTPSRSIPHPVAISSSPWSPLPSRPEHLSNPSYKPPSRSHTWASQARRHQRASAFCSEGHQAQRECDQGQVRLERM